MKNKAQEIQKILHENMGYWHGRSDASQGRKVEANDEAYFHGYRLGLTNGPPPNKYTIPVRHPELHDY